MKSTVVLLFLLLVHQASMLNIWDPSTGIYCQGSNTYGDVYLMTSMDDKGRDIRDHTYREHQEYCTLMKRRGYAQIINEEYFRKYIHNNESNNNDQCIILSQNSIVCNKLDYNDSQPTGLRGFPNNYESINFALPIPNLNAFFFYSKNVMLSVKTINLDNVGIKTIEPAAFNGLHNVETLHLQNNDIQHLDNVFGPLIALRTLNLGNNNITEIHPHAFGSLSKLNILLLANNKITQIQAELFKNLKELTELDLSNNPLNNFTFETLSVLNSLRVLSINNAHLRQKSIPCINTISDQDCGALPASIRDISLVGNNFTKINDLSYLINLENIALSNNSISILDTIFGNEIVEILLDYNNLTTLPNALFSKATKLEKLNLNHNQIKDLSEGIFQNTTSLITLSLAHNSITHLPTTLFKNLNLLRYLELSGNGLTNIPIGIFDTLTRLEILDLSSNQLKSLDEIKIHTLQKLKRLYLENNFINQLFDYTKLQFPHLEEIAIHGNQLICEDLLFLYNNLIKNGVKVLNGTDLPYIKTDNIHGIQCIEKKNSINNKLLPADLSQNLTETFANINKNMAEHLKLFKNLNATLISILNSTEKGQRVSTIQIINTLVLIFLLAIILYYLVRTKFFARRKTLERIREPSEVELF